MANRFLNYLSEGAQRAAPPPAGPGEPMARATITGPDGRRATLNIPAGATQEQVMAKAQEVKARWDELSGGNANQQAPGGGAGARGRPSPTLQEFRQKYPQYDDMSDDALAGALHSKFYADMPRSEFDKRIGHATQPSPQDGAGAPRQSVAPQGAAEAPIDSSVQSGAPGGTSQGGWLDAAQNVARSVGQSALRSAEIAVPAIRGARMAYGIAQDPEGALDAVTGSSRTEFPEASEFVPSYVEATKKGDASLMGSAITPDPQAQLDILKNNIPGLESKTDAHGNIMLKTPGMDDFAYLNKPGLSGRDVDEFGTQTLAGLPFARLFGAGGNIPARIATGALAGGGMSVSQDVAAMAQGSEQGIDPVRAGISSGVGAVAGPVLGSRANLNTPRQGTLEAAERLTSTTGVGVPVPRAVASDSRVVHAAAGGIGSTLLGSPQQAASRKLTEGLGTAAENVAERYGRGSVATEFSGGSTAREGIVNWIKRGSKAIIGKGYDDLDRLIKPGTVVPLSRTQAAAQKLTAEDVASASADGQKVIALVQDALQRGELTYAGLKELRTRIGERVFGDIAPEQGTSARALDRIYGALSEDLKYGVRRAGIAKSGSSGRKALAAFERANTVARKTFERRDSLKTIVGAEADASPERVMGRIVQMARGGGSGDLKKLAQARAAIGDEWGDVASAVVAKLGRNAGGEFSPALFIRDYGKLTKGAKNVLFSGKRNAGLRQALEDIATVSEKYQKTVSRFQNTSLTGNSILATMGLGGVFANPVAALSGAVGGIATSFILSRPVTAKLAAHWSRAYLAAATSSNRGALVVLQQAGKQLLETARQDGIEIKGELG
jgi:hypothetical protein